MVPPDALLAAPPTHLLLRAENVDAKLLMEVNRFYGVYINPSSPNGCLQRPTWNPVLQSHFSS